MEKDEKWLKEFIEQGTLNEKPHHDPDQWKSHVIGQCKSWIDNGLQSRAMTRDLDWGSMYLKIFPAALGKTIRLDGRTYRIPVCDQTMG